MKNLSTDQLKAVDSLDIRVNEKLLELDRLAKKFQNDYFLSGESSQLDAATYVLHSIDLENEHRIWQKGILTEKGEEYLSSYLNAMEQIVSNSDFLLENYVGFFNRMCQRKIFREVSPF